MNVLDKVSRQQVVFSQLEPVKANPFDFPKADSASNRIAQLLPDSDAVTALGNGVLNFISPSNTPSLAVNPRKTSGILNSFDKQLGDGENDNYIIVEEFLVKAEIRIYHDDSIRVIASDRISTIPEIASILKTIHDKYRGCKVALDLRKVDLIKILNSNENDVDYVKKQFETIFRTSFDAESVILYKGGSRLILGPPKLRPNEI